MMRARIAFAGLFACACSFGSTRAFAQLDLQALGRALSAGTFAAASSTALPKALSRASSGKLSVVVRSQSGMTSAPELTLLGRFAIASLDPARIAALGAAHPDWSFDWSPPRHPLLDRADGWVHASEVRAATNTSGQGVVVGIVDTGVDLAHADLQTADHKTRVAWLLDISRPAAGVHADLESAYGCDVASTPCAIYAGADLDALLANDISGDEPTDDLGHGTHVASLAAGNGLASKVPTYIGMAPEATLVVARVADASGAISDPDVLRAVKFVFDRAADLGMPAVVNLSLGSDFGAHDGSSALESELSSMVDADSAGHAIVVAAGNSAGLYTNADLSYPGPFGIHTEVHVPRDSISLVPLITPPPLTGGTSVNGIAYVWLGFRPGDDVSVGLDDKDGSFVPLVKPGQATTFSRPGYEATIYNGVESPSDSTGQSLGIGRNSAVLVIGGTNGSFGTWDANIDFKIHFEGEGTAELWVQGAGDLDPDANIGALFPRGLKEGTINVPASASALIGVGATLNRTTWVSAAGTMVDMPDLGALTNAPLDSIAYFSAAGPNALGALKPDLVAPGVSVAGAMAPSADPRRNGGTGLFASFGRCPGTEECFVVDDTHAITSGTSMSAPIVAGSIALLFERDPTLTQDGVRALLQAGARPLQGLVPDERQIGPGALDLEGALAAATEGDSPAERVPGAQSWLALSESYAHPDPNWPFVGYAELRDDAGEIADGFDPSRLTLSVEQANVTENLTRVAPGFYRFTLAAPSGSGGQTLRLKLAFDDQPLLQSDVPIAVDHWVADDGVSTRGGCAFAARGSLVGVAWFGAAALGCGLFVARRRRHMRAK
ncbi:MAG TPA: S8 family serine peptidase [Polyangiaceae bacterium]|jgi:subtilisin family serine protease|nr:S8 family serine peptidase [Polyangiaceae bacterium]